MEEPQVIMTDKEEDDDTDILVVKTDQQGSNLYISLTFREERDG